MDDGKNTACACLHLLRNCRMRKTQYHPQFNREKTQLWLTSSISRRPVSSPVLDELEWRGLISQSTDRDRLAEALNGDPISYYCGFDPTAASLHIGNLVQLINMRHLQAAGHHPIALVGGATGLIGDPRQSGERTLNPKDVVAGWAERLKAQIGGILRSGRQQPGPFRVQLRSGSASMNVIDFLRDVGKNFRLGTMLAKDTVARRLNSEDGISFTEFSYQVLQGNDFLHLFDEYHRVLELGGSDQWGNPHVRS